MINETFWVPGVWRFLAYHRGENRYNEHLGGFMSVLWGISLISFSLFLSQPDRGSCLLL